MSGRNIFILRENENSASIIFVLDYTLFIYPN